MIIEKNRKYFLIKSVKYNSYISSNRGQFFTPKLREAVHYTNIHTAIRIGGGHFLHEESYEVHLRFGDCVIKRPKYIH